MEYKLKHGNKKRERAFFKTINNEPSKTRQEFTKSCDINQIVKKNIMTNGQFIPPGNSTPLYADVSDIPDFRTALDRVIYAKEAFTNLPSNIVKRFNNDPDKLVEFVNDPANLREGIELGLFTDKGDIIKEPGKAATPEGVAAKQAEGAVDVQNPPSSVDGKKA